MVALALWPIQAIQAQSIPIEVTQADVEFDVQTGDPVVTFRMTPGSTRAFAELTQKNVGRKAAIKVDGRELSVPVIREPILGGQGQSPRI
jgi:preprotein translocase subunit SecD